MKIGLLVCDKFKYSDEFGDFLDMFQALFPAYQFDAINVYLGEFPENVDKYEVYMATGSAHSVYEDLPWIHVGVLRRTLH